MKRDCQNDTDCGIEHSIKQKKRRCSFPRAAFSIVAFSPEDQAQAFKRTNVRAILPRYSQESIYHLADVDF
jgi:hypothetical protein